MEITPLPIQGCYRIDYAPLADDRGSFIKTVHAPTFAAAGLSWGFREAYYSHSTAGVLRGMHLQVPPYEHAKLVYCLAGQALDVLVDLRKGPGFGAHTALELNSERPVGVYVAPGVAHGFLARTDCTLQYMVTTEHAPSHDTGIRWDSFGFDWGIAAPVVSERDAGLVGLGEF